MNPVRCPSLSLVIQDVQTTFLGVIWDGTFVAALVAAVVGIVSLITVAVQSKAARIDRAEDARNRLEFEREAEGRNQFQNALTVATNQALSLDLRERAVGLIRLVELLDDPWATEKHKELVLAVGVILERS